jgi:hypothetical protein
MKRLENRKPLMETQLLCKSGETSLNLWFCNDKVLLACAQNQTLTPNTAQTLVLKVKRNDLPHHLLQGPS